MTGMVEVGERAGRLEQVLEGLSTHYRREARVRESIRAAVAYPLVLAGIMAVVMGILLVGVLPVFSRAFGQPGRPGVPRAAWRPDGWCWRVPGWFWRPRRCSSCYCEPEPGPGLALFYRLFPSARRAAGMPERLPVCLGDFPDASERL